jgi:hypothetical protein
VAQGEDPEFKSQYHKKKKKRRRSQKTHRLIYRYPPIFIVKE